jgi:hypothetical protein
LVGLVFRLGLVFMFRHLHIFFMGEVDDARIAVVKDLVQEPDEVIIHE